ncbi:hypothetical protein [Amycolatopsis samaneae]
MSLAETRAELAATGGVHQATFHGYHAIVQHRRYEEPGRLDVFYTNPDKVYTSIGNWLTGLARFRVNPCFGHAVVKHGRIIEWWLVFGDGRFRLTPLEPTAMARSLLYRAARAHSLDSYTVRQYGILVGGLTAGSALGAVSGGLGAVVAKQAAVAVSEALSDSAAKSRETVKSALCAHIAEFMRYALAKQREFDEMVVASRAAGRPWDPAVVSGYAMLPGYCVTHRFSSPPGDFTFHYSGDGNVPFGNNQGTIVFTDYRITSWWYLGPGRKRLKIVPD